MRYNQFNSYPTNQYLQYRHLNNATADMRNFGGGGFLLPFLAGAALTAPFFGGGFGRGIGAAGLGAGGFGAAGLGLGAAGLGLGGAFPQPFPLITPSPYFYYNRRPFILY